MIFLSEKLLNVSAQITFALLEHLVDHFLHFWRELDILKSKDILMVMIVSFSGGRFVEDVGKEDGFELVHVVDFGGGQKQRVGAEFGVVFGCFMEDLVRLVSEAIFAVFLVERLVNGQMAGGLIHVQLRVVYRTDN